MGKITVELYLSTFGTTLHRLNHPKGGGLFEFWITGGLIKSGGLYARIQYSDLLSNSLADLGYL